MPKDPFLDNANSWSLRRLWQLAAALPLVGIVLLASAGTASAHVDLLLSDPVDQARLDTPVDEIRLEFTEAAQPAGEGLQLVDGAGEPLPAEIAQVDETVLVITPAEPLVDGSYGIAWTVRAGDAHPRSGTIAFSISLPTPDPVEPQDSTTSTPPDTAAPPPTTEIPAEDATSPPTTAPPESQDPATSETPIVIPIAQSSSPTGDWPARAGRFLAMTGVLIAIGTIAFAMTTLTGTADEAQQPAYWIRRSAIGILAGTILEAYGASITLSGSLIAALSPSAILDALAGTYGVALLLRFVGAIAMIGWANPNGILSIIDADGPDPTASSGDTAVQTRPSVSRFRFDATQSPVAIGGVVLALVSYTLDGHTVTASPAALVRVTDLIHVVAAGIWVGGVLLLGRTLAGRWRRGVKLEATALAITFSRTASVALVATAVAGMALAWSILDTPGELLSTEWGQTLSAKLTLVSVAAGIGGYNHRYVVPLLHRDDEDTEHKAHLLRRVIGVEGIVLVGVVVATAFLVGAPS